MSMFRLSNRQIDVVNVLSPGAASDEVVHIELVGMGWGCSRAEARATLETLKARGLAAQDEKDFSVFMLTFAGYAYASGYKRGGE